MNNKINQLIEDFNSLSILLKQETQSNYFRILTKLDSNSILELSLINIDQKTSNYKIDLKNEHQTWWLINLLETFIKLIYAIRNLPTKFMETKIDLSYINIFDLLIPLKNETEFTSYIKDFNSKNLELIKMITNEQKRFSYFKNSVFYELSPIEEKNKIQLFLIENNEKINQIEIDLNQNKKAYFDLQNIYNFNKNMLNVYRRISGLKKPEIYKITIFSKMLKLTKVGKMFLDALDLKTFLIN